MEKVYYEIMCEKDQMEGRRGREETNICFENKDEALMFVNSEIWSKQFGVMGVSSGGPSYISYRTKRFYNTFEEYCEENGFSDIYKKEDLRNKRKNALNKLTEEEKKILGL